VLALDYALAGLGLGAIAALSGVGLLVTYRATGVFNVAHGRGRDGRRVLVLAADGRMGPAGLAVGDPRASAGSPPAFGVVAERVVFPSAATTFSPPPAESLVATIGILVLLLGIAYAVWGTQTRHPTSLFLAAGLASGLAHVARRRIRRPSRGCPSALRVLGWRYGSPRSVRRSVRSSTGVTSPSCPG